LIKKIKGLTLAIIQVGDRPDSISYIKAKNKFAEEIGAKIELIKFPITVTQSEVLSAIKSSTANGIILQLPIPDHLHKKELLDAIDPKKDVDGLGRGTHIPATARGIKELLEFYTISLKDKKVTVMGRSDLVGKPVARMCEQEGAIVTVCYRETKDIPTLTKQADIVIVAIGQPKHVTSEFVRPGQIIIDVGINRTNEGIVGDVDFNAVAPIVAAITPVPGGVGQMTVLALFENLVDAVKP
jgi:methylenetetrahydrofolate dehydrogenase (NADP+)/methenyltetrahydrofolate cyclohydrolase